MHRIAIIAGLLLSCTSEPELVATVTPIGLYTSPNEIGAVPEGALVQADNVVISREKVLETRRGQGPSLATGASKLWPWKDRLLVHNGTTLSYTDTAVSTKTDYAGTVNAPTGRRLRMAFQNGNAYIATADGVKRLDAVTASLVDAGVPMGLDVQGALQGSSGFLPNNSAVAYRVVWGLRDANGNLLLGAPSGRSVLVNQAGGSRDVAVSTSIPAGLTASHFWQLYRTQNSVDASTDPGDEMGLVYEGALPSTADVTQLARLTNVVTATTSVAHGFSVGQIVRIGPGGIICTHAVAGGAASVERTVDHGTTYSAAGITGWGTATYAIACNGAIYVAVGDSECKTSPDGLTWTNRTIPAKQYRAIAWGAGKFVAVSADFGASYSTDGITWVDIAPGAAGGLRSYNWRAIVWTGSRFVALSYADSSPASAYFSTSPDGITWDLPRNIAGVYGINAAVWTGVQILAVGLATATTPVIIYGDGTNWVVAASGAPTTGSLTATASNGSITVALGPAQAFYSADHGQTWSAASGAPSAVSSATWDGTNFIAVGTDTAVTAPTAGNAWTTRTIAAGTYRAVVGGGGPLFLSGEYTIASVPTSTTFTYPEAGADGTLVQAQTATPLTATVVDQIPSTFVGATLYASPSQGGLLASQYEPPSCVDMATFRGSVFWLGTTDKATLDFWVLAAGAPSGIQNGDTITVNGMVFTATTGAESVSGRQFTVVTSGTVSQNVRDTTTSLIRVVNRAQGSAVYARDLSSANDQPGHVGLTARARNDSITVAVSRSASWIFTGGTTKAPETKMARLRWSPQNIPDAAPLTAYQDLGDPLLDGMRVIALRDSLFILKKDGVWRATGDRFDFQTGPTFQPFDTTTEIVAPETAVALDNVIFALTTKGVVQISDTGVTLISRPIEDQIRPLLVEPMLSTVRTVAHAVAYESDGKYILWVPTSSADTQATKALVYDHFASLSIRQPVWTARTDAASTAVINPFDGKLYVGTASAVTKERKALDYTDFADGEVAVTINSATGADVTLASVAGIAAGDMLVKGSSRGVVLSVASSTLTLDRTWAGGTGAATVYKAIPAQFRFASFHPVTGGLTHFREVAFLFRNLSGGYFTADFSTEIMPAWSSVPFYGTRDYQLDETAVKPLNLRTLVTPDDRRAMGLSVRFTHTQAMCPIQLEGLSYVFTPTSIRLRR